MIRATLFRNLIGAGSGHIGDTAAVQAVKKPPLWMTVRLAGGLPMGPAKDLEAAKAEFKAAWETLKARTPPDWLAAYRATNIRDDG